MGTRWLDWEGAGDEGCGFGMSRLADTPRLETGEGEGWGQSVEVGDSMSVLVTGCLGWGQGVGAGDRASRLTPPSLHQGVFGDKPSLPEYKVAAIRKPPLILLHYGAFKAGWDGLILLATLYVAVTVPYSVCVGAGGEEGLPAARSPPSACDLCVEILFMLGKAPHAHPAPCRLGAGRGREDSVH